MRPAKDTCLSGYDLQGIHEPTLPIHEPTLPIHEPTLPIHEPLMNHPVPLLTQTCQEPCPLGNWGTGALLRTFRPQKERDEAVTSGDMLGGLEYKLGGLTDHLGGLSDLGGLSGRRRSSGTGPGFAHFCTQKASGDEAVTSGDEFSGLEFAGFSGQKTEFGARRTPGSEKRSAVLQGLGTQIRKSIG